MIDHDQNFDAAKAVINLIVPENRNGKGIRTSEINNILNKFCEID